MAQDLLARRLLWALAALCLAAFAALAPHLLYADLNLDYPFVDGDSYDWIANGLHLAGHDVRYSGRPPLLPLALAGLDRLGLLPCWPALALAAFLLTVLGFYTLAARLFHPAAAFAAALVLLASYSLQGLAIEVMADVPASCLLFFGLRAFLVAAGDPPRPRRYVWSGLAAGLSALTQAPATLIPLAAGATLAARRRRDLATPWPWLGLLLAAGLPAAWLGVRRFALAAYGDSLIDPSILLGFHLGSWRFALWSLVSLLGLPACLLLAAGLLLAVRRAVRGGGPEPAAVAGLLALLSFLMLCGFFAFFYRYDAKRFLVYSLWPAALLIALALSALVRLPRRAGRLVFAAVAVAAVGGAALPLPEPAHDGSWAALWPLPPLAAHLTAGDARPGERRLPAVETLDPARLASWSVFGRVRAAAAARPPGQGRPGPALFAAADSALYLYGRDGDGGGRYRTLTRLSNALYKPVRYVPRSALDRYWPLLSPALLAQLTADYAVYRVSLPGASGCWLLVTPGDRPLAPALLPPADGGSRTAPRVPPLPPGQPARALAEAAAIRDYVGRANAYVALIPTPLAPRAANLAQLYLLFYLRTTELYVVEPADVAGVRGLLGGSPAESERRIGAARIASARVLGRRTMLISFAR
jgi:Dolichyl-phosphate-mannose-protein mannosyltransferase